MIKCPNCGSTAQVKVLRGDDLNKIWIGSFDVLCQYLYCDCGCEFIRVFEFKEEINITSKEDGG